MSAFWAAGATVALVGWTGAAPAPASAVPPKLIAARALEGELDAGFARANDRVEKLPDAMPRGVDLG